MQCVSSAQHFLTSINHTGDGIPFDKIASASFVNLLHQSSACGEDFVVRDEYLPRDPFSLDDLSFEFSEKAVVEAEAAAVGGNKRAAAGAGTGGGSTAPRDTPLLQATKSRKTVSVADVRATHRGRRGADGSSSSAASNAAGGAPGTAGTSAAGGGRRRQTARARTKTGNNAGPGRAACPPARLAASRVGGANRLALAPRASVARANAPPPPLPRTPIVPRTPLYRAPLYRAPLYRPPPPPPRPPGSPWMSTFYSPPSAAFSGCRTRFPVDSFEKHFSLWRHDLMRSRLVLLRCHARHLKAKSSTENLAEVAPPLDEDVASWVQVAHDGGEDWEAEREQYMETQRCIWSKLRDPAEPETAAPAPAASVVEYPVRDAPRDNVRRRARGNKNKGRGKNKNKSQCNVKGKIRAAAKSKLQAVAAAAAAAARGLRRPPSAVPSRPLASSPLSPIRPPLPSPLVVSPVRPKSRTTPLSAARSLASVRAGRRSPAPPANRQTRVRAAGSYVSLCGPSSPGSAPTSATASARGGASRRSLVDSARNRAPPHYTVRVRPPARGSRWSSRAASEPPGRRPRARRPRPRPARRLRPISATSTFSDVEG